MHMRCPIQTGAPRVWFYTWFLCLSSIQVQHYLTTHYLTHTHYQVQRNYISMASSST